MIINILDEIVANQIAAGEVVSRPSSVVKELMENSLDAKASEITLNIKDAGKTFIEVLDNGCGMDEEDSKRCFLSHATSKIKKESDLHNLSTMGFRGEALASIAAISQVELKTKQEGKELGTEVIIEGGKIKEENSTTCKKGTSIKVKNLFFNTPARRNFLKSDQIENSHIMDEFIRIALVNNDIKFSYYNNDKLIFSLEKNNRKKRIIDLFGNTYNDKLLSIEETVDIISISGFISSINLTRKNKNDEYFFVNNRFMKSNYLANAVERAYMNLIPEKTYPTFFISLTVNPKDIDVNIHPTKTEVKFVNEKAIYAILYAATRKTLGMNTLATTLDFEKKDIVFPHYDSKTPTPQQPKINYNSSYNPFSKNSFNNDFDSKINKVKVETEISFSSKDNEEKYENNNIFPTIQFLNSYIITQINSSIIVINQHIASKKIIFEKLIKKQPLNLTFQKLLMPYNHHFEPKESFKILENKNFINSLGYKLQEKEDGSFDILAIPCNSTIEEAINTIEEVINEDNNSVLSKEKQEQHCLLLAERLSIKEGKVMNKQEIMYLISELFKLTDIEELPNKEKVLIKIDNTFLKNVFH